MNSHPENLTLESEPAQQAGQQGRCAVAPGSRLRLVPLSIKAAGRFVAEHHRHNRPPQGALFAVGAKRGEQLAGVAIIGRPVARMLDDGERASFTATRLPWGLSVSPTLAGRKVATVLKEYQPAPATKPKSHPTPRLTHHAQAA